MSYGIVVNPLLENEIDRKENGVLIDVVKRPWLQTISEKFIVEHEGKLYTTSDVSLVYYLMWKYPKYTWNIVHPYKTPYAEMLANKLNFFFIYNRSESYMFDTKEHYQQSEKMWNLPNVYPPQQWQNLVDHKHNMYKYLQDNGINVTPFIYIAQKEYVQMQNPQYAIDKIKTFVHENGLKRIVVRPEFGTITTDTFACDVDELEKPDMIEKLDDMLRSYPGIYITEYISGFRKYGEYKIYFVGGKPIAVLKLSQSIEDDSEGVLQVVDVDNPKNESVVTFAKKVYDVLPRFIIRGVEIDKILIRIDVTCCLHNGIFAPKHLFVNEIECVPSFFTACTDAGKTNIFMETNVGDAIVNAIENYQRRKKKNEGSWMYTFLAILFVVMAAVVVLQNPAKLGV